MKITVDRTIQDNKLVFTITCEDPHFPHFKPEDFEVMKRVASAQRYMEEKTEGVNLQSIANALHMVEDRFSEICSHVVLKSIEEQFYPRYRAIAGELYSWLLESQDSEVVNWMGPRDPDRIKYLFDNDPRVGE